MFVKVEDKVKVWMKVAFVLTILTIILIQFKKLFSDFDTHTFYIYKDKLSFISLSIIVILGLVSYLPLSLYDFIIKDTCDISLDNKSLYKSSWIASSISSIVGFGGTAAIALKSHFYSPYIKDKAKLVKEVSKVVLLNFTGFSAICLIYSILNISSLNKIELVKLGIGLASLYAPIIFIYNVYRCRNKEKRENAIKTIKIMIISILEWIAMALLLFSILKLLGNTLPLSKVFPIYVVSSAIGIVSMMPGGIGGFDLSFILGVSALGINKEEALLALVLYRISYYIIPLTVGVFLFIYEAKTKMDKDYINIFKLAKRKIINIVKFTKQDKVNKIDNNKEV
ncbi:flippase-like domain-containing protein [Clostridium tertium]|uniref:Phosphatidylglycerol lysyltransferase n=1 Tax=Clostridium tertium TaxID=1559 RepID=A0A9X3XH82_9CLOT|nr:flippase-like domain-containing protein [Clostridium tertium]MDB1947017.1 flippase-like domain-containing protein [Clostridium tertium]MDB1953826.1 flippase-like domain-containing protein [Clostridium tertium]MDB1964112.1 flippase-like domain-containing protein [Clostridium tertium]MDB1965428.1 flippase-like domain-containing protein [Clostridium tertium]MDC4239023.1 flippase-like domain-containing protein [Clostridium tertium]